MRRKEVENQIQAFAEAAKYDEAINLIVTHFQKDIYFQIRRYVTFHDDANDILQEVLLKIWKALPNFRFQSALYIWIYRITANECLGFIRSNKKYQNAVSASDYADLLKSDSYFDGNEFERKLQAAVASLPDKQRLVFNAKYFDDLKYDEIADIMGGSTGSLKASYHHAVKKIEEFLKQD